VRAALDADPSSADVKALERRVKAQMREQDKKEAKVYGRMLAALAGGKGRKGGGGGEEKKGEEEGGEAAEAGAAPAADAPAVVEASA
jgi:hypothetical protein